MSKPPGRSAPKLVADLLRDDADRDAACPQTRGHALLEQARELQLGQPDVAVRIALDLAQGEGIQPLDEAFGEQGDAVLAPQDATLDDRAFEGVGDLVEAHRAVRELLADDGQGRAGGAADAEGEMAGVPAHDRDEEPLVGRRGVLHEVAHEVLAHVDRRREANVGTPGGSGRSLSIVFGT